MAPSCSQTWMTWDFAAGCWPVFHQLSRCTDTQRCRICAGCIGNTERSFPSALCGGLQSVPSQHTLSFISSFHLTASRHSSHDRTLRRFNLTSFDSWQYCIMQLLHIASFHLVSCPILSQGTWCYEILFSAILQDLRIMRMKWDVLSVSSRTCRRNSAMQRMLTLCAPDFVINWRLSQKWPRNMLRAYWRIWRASKPEALTERRFLNWCRLFSSTLLLTSLLWMLLRETFERSEWLCFGCPIVQSAALDNTAKRHDTKKTSQGDWPAKELQNNPRRVKWYYGFRTVSLRRTGRCFGDGEQGGLKFLDTTWYNNTLPFPFLPTPFRLGRPIPSNTHHIHVGRNMIRSSKQLQTFFPFSKALHLEVEQLQSKVGCSLWYWLLIIYIMIFI